MEGLRLIQEADIRNKLVLVRVDHNVVKKGKIKDPYRIECSFATLYEIAKRGGRPILMTHVGRPRDKKTGTIRCSSNESVLPIVGYMRNRLPVKIHVPEFPIDPERGILHVEDSVKEELEDLKSEKIDMIYLPNTRWFQGEEAKGPEREEFTKELASLADVYINDAFGSWQAHASTYDIAMLLPSYAGILMQKELSNLDKVLSPERPFVAVIAGAKYDTKIGPLKALYERVDKLILGGVLYNTLIAAKYDLDMKGVPEEDIELAKELVDMDRRYKKIVEMPSIVESETLEGRVEGSYRKLNISELKARGGSSYIVDISSESFDDPEIKQAISSANTIFVNAVMGLMPWFYEGSQAVYNLISKNTSALKLFAGGDTLEALKELCPGIYLKGLDNPEKYYYFTGGGSVLKAIEEGSPFGLRPVQALIS